ncbi:putative internalin B [Nitritalea halalkaliphila LW7]|uniref:Putative internalin B n=1 Tax=Nitritalea halalkaliphila LW7 TaxID=1189621 RepID=I5C067_9BACT|nr:leucine-rich repeat domain-containing protein [Nitritalea halalkaliphila]EIM75219.1 putative internalin B [Nitritalea halalkaliphila LW7]
MKSPVLSRIGANSFFALCLSALFLMSSCSDEVDPIVEDDPEPELVTITDPELLDIVLETLNLNSAAALNEESIKGLTSLNLSNSVVASFSGLEKAENLEVLLGRGLDVADYSPLSGLVNLEEIDLRDAVLPTSLEWLSALENLRALDVQNTAVADISALSGKTNLKVLNLRETDVTDISALEGMVQLEFLNLNRAGGGNGIDNPEVIIPFENLYYLSLRNTNLGDELFAELMANKTQLVESNVRNTGITSVAPLVALFEAGAFTEALSTQYGNKISLDLQNNAITDLCLINAWTGNFPEGELEWSAVAGDFENCEE